jgi:hypothetical protein
MTMVRASRIAATLAAVAIAGVLLWAATYLERTDTDGYWAAYGIVAAAGLVVALAQMRGRQGYPWLMLALVFLPVMVAAGWVLVAMQPHSNWFRAHALAWSGDMGIRGLVTELGTWLGVLAFGIGYTLGLALEPAPACEVVDEPAYDRTIADEPMAAERREVTDEQPVREAQPVR